MFQAHAMPLGVAQCLADLAGLSRGEGDLSAAQSLYSRALAAFHELCEGEELVRTLEELAHCAANQERWDRAVRLAAGASAVRVWLGSQLPPSRIAALDSTLAIAREHLERGAAATAWMEGSSLPLAKLIAYARDTGAETAIPPP
jgi:hypothetical protein